MAPAADLDERLIALQAAVAEARIHHQDLCERRDVCKRMKYHASAQSLDLKAQRAFNELRKKSEALATYISKKARGIKP